MQTKDYPRMLRRKKSICDDEDEDEEGMMMMLKRGRSVNETVPLKIMRINGCIVSGII